MGGGPVGSKEVPRLSSFELATGWSFRQADCETGRWLPVKKVPSTVHQDLIDNGALEDPFAGFNELQAEWVGTQSWTYQFQFSTPSVAHDVKAVLAFDGLDTLAEVRLNGEAILKSDNMFVSHRKDVTEALRSRSQHHLQITFDSALLKAREIQKAYPEHKWICFNGESARLAVRKAQYHWGWDWGPFLMCAGIWRPIRLETYTARVEDLKTEVTVAPDHESATVRVKAKIESKHRENLAAKFEIFLEGERISGSLCDISSEGYADAQVHIRRPSLWMPAGYGARRLYDVQVTLHSQETEVHSESRKIGLRSVELIQQPDSHGKSFHFRINGVDIFCGGSCWIPADSFLTNISPERYRAWIELMIPANQKMIRVWGGGIYEHDSFYTACDELGILVWQDFMFACGNYPCFSSILTSIRDEATISVRNLRHHPSIVIFAGNNEDYQVAESAGLTYDYSNRYPEDWLKTDFPARYIYEWLLPGIVRAECPGTPYHPGSPWGDGKKTSDPTVGDLHQWNVWHGTQEKYQVYASLGGRFNSEFGMEAFPSLETVRSFVPEDKALHPQSQVMDFHNKAAGHERRIATYMVENVRTATELSTYIHLTQLVQAEALAYAYRGWRKQWGTVGDRRCGGALVWQLNDCWPTISWSICDYYLRKKPAYYAIARCLAPLAVGVRREHFDWSASHAREPRSLKWEVWGLSSLLEEVEVDVEVRFWGVEGGKEVRERIVKKGVVLYANGTTDDIASGSIDTANEVPHVIAARMWRKGEIAARDMDWPQPLKYLPFPERKVKLELQGEQMYITAERPVKCLVFEEREGCVLSDNALDLAPDDGQIIVVKGRKDGDEPPRWTHLGQTEQ